MVSKKVNGLVIDDNKFCSEEGVIYNKRRTILFKVPTDYPKEEFVIERRVKKIAEGAFQGCKNIKKIILPEGITELYNNTFEGCSSLQCINIPEGIRKLPYCIFKGCSSLESINLPESIDVINEEAFEDCTSLRSLSLPGKFFLLYNDSLKGCVSLENIDIPSENKRYTSVDGILYSKDMQQICAYPAAHPAKTYIIPNTVNVLDSTLFENCKNLQELHIHDYITIKANLIKKCSALTAIHVHIKNVDLAPICKEAFDGVYKSLCTLDVPQGHAAEYKKHPAFASFDKIEEEQQDNNAISGMDMAELSSDGSVLLQIKDQYKVYISHFDVPEGIKIIEKNAFVNCEHLESISFPNTLECINVGAFRKCSALKEVTLPSSLREIQNFAFDRCSLIDNISLPAGVRRIGYDFLKDTAVKDILIPSSVKRIDPNAFRGCSLLSAINVDTNNPYFASQNGVLYNKDMTELLIVPSCTNITDFIIPESVVFVSKDSFHNCTGINNIHIPGNIEDFDYSIFQYGLENLDSISINDDCKYFKVIDGVLFSNDGKVLIRMPKNAQRQVYEVPSFVEKILSNAFINCKDINEIRLPEGLTSIEQGAFEGCENVSCLHVLCSLISLEWNSFSDLDPQKCKVYVPESTFEFGWRGTAIEDFDVYSLKDLEEGSRRRETKLTGSVYLKDVNSISRRIYDYLDISEAEFGFEEEKWSTCLGISHSGPVYGNSGVREVDILQRLLSQVKATTIVLPDDVMRRHINTAKKNKYIKQLIVRDTCKLFAYENGKLMNKKKTIVVFEQG